MAWLYNVHQACHAIWCKFIICDVCPMSQCRCVLIPLASLQMCMNWNYPDLLKRPLCAWMFVVKSLWQVLSEEKQSWMFSSHKSLVISLPVQLSKSFNVYYFKVRRAHVYMYGVSFLSQDLQEIRKCLKVAKATCGRLMSVLISSPGEFSHIEDPKGCIDIHSSSRGRNIWKLHGDKLHDLNYQSVCVSRLSWGKTRR